MNCTNCNAKLSCGCQKRVASDGKQVCSSCVSSYEQKLKAIKEANANHPDNLNINPPS
jgi:hypothetical protein